MYKPRHFLKNVISGRNCYCYCSSSLSKTLNCSNALIVSKLSSYEFEKYRHSHMTVDELRRKLMRRGTDYDRLMRNHEAHKQYECNMVRKLENMGFSVRVVNSFSYDEDSVDWADVIFPTGGDGTFLLAAGKVRTNKLPVIGFNSAPDRSEGHLCLPKRYSNNVEEAIEKLRSGQFEWLLRKRIRVTLAGDRHDMMPTPLHEIHDKISFEPKIPKVKDDNSQLVPHLALNEVFIGETLSARVSNLELWLDRAPESSIIKCSGLCISTGTGSTSWHLSMNRLPVHTVEALLELLHHEPKERRQEMAKVLADMYNGKLIFDAAEDRLAYTIREMICLGVWPQGRRIRRRGFVNTIKVKSRCFDAALVIDGGVSYAFNDGTIAELILLPEDALLTVKFHN